jgi:hypothetical protein
LFPLSAKLAVEGVPRRPTLRQARVPAPPPLPDDDQDAAEWLARLYQDLRRLRHPGPAGRFGWRGPLRRQGWWKSILAGIRALREHDLNPVQWLGWSFALWGGKGAPPMAWVFSPQRMADRRGWFSSEAEDVAFGGRIVPTQTAVELWSRWRAMEAALYRIGPATPNRVRDVASMHLTLDDVERLTREANAEAEEMQAQLRADVDRGRWVWL